MTLAHQHQRARNQVTVEGKTVTYIEATEADVALAERLCGHVLGTTTDELSPATRNLLSPSLDFAATDGSRFTRRELRSATGLGDSQLKVHLARLVDLEYVAAERAGPATCYELAADTSTAGSAGSNADRPVTASSRPIGSQGYRPAPFTGALGAGDNRSGRPRRGRETSLFQRRSVSGHGSAGSWPPTRDRTGRRGSRVGWPV